MSRRTEVVLLLCVHVHEQLLPIRRLCVVPPLLGALETNMLITRLGLRALEGVHVLEPLLPIGDVLCRVLNTALLLLKITFLPNCPAHIFDFRLLRFSDVAIVSS